MPSQQQHDRVVKKAGVISESQLYWRVLVLGVLLFSLFFSYTSWMGIPGALNKAVADTAIVLIGLSMLLSSLCYFWDFVDTKIVYRKHLGLIGYAFGLVHIGLSFGMFQRLFSLDAWIQDPLWPAITGFIATVIFTGMALISNSFSARILGGKVWRWFLRTGYVAVAFIWLHVYLLKSSRWISWWADGMQRPPSLSLLVTLFMTIVILMRIALWWSLRRKKV